MRGSLSPPYSPTPTSPSCAPCNTFSVAMPVMLCCRRPFLAPAVRCHPAALPWRKPWPQHVRCVCAAGTSATSAPSLPSREPIPPPICAALYSTCTCTSHNLHRTAASRPKRAVCPSPKFSLHLIFSLCCSLRLGLRCCLGATFNPFLRIGPSTEIL